MSESVPSTEERREAAMTAATKAAHDWWEHPQEVVAREVVAAFEAVWGEPVEMLGGKVEPPPYRPERQSAWRAGYADALADLAELRAKGAEGMTDHLSRSAMSGADLIAAERERQVAEECWTERHDDLHGRAELADAAVCYALAYTEKSPPGNGRWSWPWEQRWWKPSDRKRNLVKAGALIAAEIDRLQRQERRDA